MSSLDVRVAREYLFLKLFFRYWIEILKRLICLIGTESDGRVVCELFSDIRNFLMEVSYKAICNVKAIGMGW